MRGRDQSIEVGILRHVGCDEACRVPEPPCDGLTVLRVAVGQDHAGTLRNEDRSHRLADERRGSRDDDDLAVELAHGRQTPTRWRRLFAAHSSRALRTAALSLTSGTPTSHQAPPSVQVYWSIGTTIT